MDIIRQEDIYRYANGREYVHQTLDSSGWSCTFIHAYTEIAYWGGDMTKYHPIGTKEEAVACFRKKMDLNLTQRVCRVSRYLTDREAIPVIQEVICYQEQRD